MTASIGEIKSLFRGVPISDSSFFTLSLSLLPSLQVCRRLRMPAAPRSSQQRRAWRSPPGYPLQYEGCSTRRREGSDNPPDSKQNVRMYTQEEKTKYGYGWSDGQPSSKLLSVRFCLDLPLFNLAPASMYCRFPSSDETVRCCLLSRLKRFSFLVALGFLARDSRVRETPFVSFVRRHAAWTERLCRAERERGARRVRRGGYALPGVFGSEADNLGLEA